MSQQCEGLYGRAALVCQKPIFFSVLKLRWLVKKHLYRVSQKKSTFLKFWVRKCDNYGPTKQTGLYEMVQQSITVQIIQMAQYSPLLGSKVVQNSHMDL